MSTDAPLSARRRATLNRLLDAGAEVFAETGLQGVSVEAICARAGFTRGAFYSNFSSKEELFLALLDREYALKSEDLRARGNELTALLRQQDRAMTVDDAARYVSEFFTLDGSEATWFALESEFALLAMREPARSPGLSDFVGRFQSELAELVEGIVHVAGRRFTMPVERAIPILIGIYERAHRITALSGPGAPEGIDELGERIAELLFAITTESPTAPPDA
jgi:AcrR family transcriptional regulator